MKRISILLSILVMVLGLALSANAALVDMRDGTIYDTDTQLSWLKDAQISGLITWDQAVAWAASLNSGVGFAGLTGWRLPNADPSCYGVNCSNSEMGHLYYSELGNAAGGPLTNTGPFTNFSGFIHWSGTEYAPDTTAAWAFYDDGGQYHYLKFGNYYAFAVRPGARVTPVPASGTVSLIILGLAGVMIYGTRLRKATR